MTNSPSSSAELFKNLGGQASGETSTENQAETQNESQDQGVSELELLKDRARKLGISFSNNLKDPEVLKAKIQAKLEGTQVADENTGSDQPVPTTETPAPVLTPAQQKAARRRELHAQEMRLVRCRITNLNPSKKDLPGEIFTFANELLGAVRKYIPYGEATDNGYHIPYCIYRQLKEREFQQIKTTKDSKGRQVVTTRMAREFAIEVLPPLTEKELAQLAAAQAAAAGMD